MSTSHPQTAEDVTRRYSIVCSRILRSQIHHRNLISSIFYNDWSFKLIYFQASNNANSNHIKLHYCNESNSNTLLILVVSNIDPRCNHLIMFDPRRGHLDMFDPRCNHLLMLDPRRGHLVMFDPRCDHLFMFNPRRGHSPSL